MSKTLRLLLAAVIACVAQTTLVRYVRIAGIAPDLMIAMLTALTTYCGSYGGFCTGSVMAMLYDASVGYVLAVNLVMYTFIGWAAPYVRMALKGVLHKLKHKSFIEMFITCAFMTLIREVVYIGYLFLIGAEQGVITLIRMLMCAAYSGIMVLPCSWILRAIMTWHPLKGKKTHEDLVQDDATETRR